MNVTSGQGVLIGGLVIEGTTSKTVLIRASGPALSLFGVAGVLADPKINVYSGTVQMQTNAGWGTGASTSAQISAAAAQVGAFPFPSGSKDSAVLITLAPGAYTIVVSSVGNTSGVALLEVYDTE